jgi:hypothetical protein
MTADSEDVLDADGNSEEWFFRGPARGDFLVRGIGLRQRVGSVVTQEGVDAFVNAFDLVEA